MKTTIKLILLIAGIIYLILAYSCSRKRTVEKWKNDIDFSILIYDNCKYILAKPPNGDYGWIMAHKGNCKYCVERQFDLNYYFNTKNTDK